jgi:hypothetical protein
MKDTLLKIINEDSTYNKSATRWLKSTHPDLWARILTATNFLPDGAKPKQRIWHILNDFYSRPICPVTGSYVKWREKKYDSFASVAAKNKAIGDIVSKSTSGAGHWRNKDVNKAAQASLKYATGIKDGRIKVDRTLRDEAAIAQKTKNTCLEKYGVTNGSKTDSAREKISKKVKGITRPPEFRQAVSDAAIKNGATPKHLRQARDLYFQAVGYWTKKSWQENFDAINPNSLDRSKFDLDHIYSKQQGFLDGIPSYIIGHWTNLRLLDKKENYSKGKRCDKTQEQLFEDFFAAVTG